MNFSSIQMVDCNGDEYKFENKTDDYINQSNDPEKIPNNYPEKDPEKYICYHPERGIDDQFSSHDNSYSSTTEKYLGRDMANGVRS